MLSISKTTVRQFILGKQGLFPGRRWQGKDGVVQAVRAGCVVQVDPLNVVARSHDIALYGRVQDYLPHMLDSALYQDRTLFDYGGTVMIHPMEELPYWRVVMARKRNEARWLELAAEFPDVVRDVSAALQERGPLSARDFGDSERRERGFRSAKVTGQVLYMLWLSGDLMTHSRKGLTRVYDVRERVAPPAFQHAVTPEAADDFFMRKVFDEINMVTQRSWRGWYGGLIERKVDAAEASQRLNALLNAGSVTQVMLEDEPDEPRFMLTRDVPLLESVHRGAIPDAWSPVERSPDEMIFLAPLEIVSARGRALKLFDFEYLWEVYKPLEKRRWGYYTLPILYQDQLVARMDSKLERDSASLVLLGFWLEKHAQVDAPFVEALAAGFRTFMRFVGAKSVDLLRLSPPTLYQALRDTLDSA